MKKLFIIMSLSFCVLIPFQSNATPTDQNDSWGSTVYSGAENAREWVAKMLGYGQNILSKTQTVEVLPYRYAFLLCFLGGVTGALCVYYLHCSSRTIARYEFQPMRDHSHSFFSRPATFRSTADEDCLLD
ncbi:hypothetical protein HYX58_00490 [Candidatus Dependentiae bacterium]|nr:hypothetical protein [Candidatus Dependentiae bacterium]